ncbi:uncharacterized protein si:dkeyp-38g8.5 [Corythoichthys intestinalis]|uniref:uncharacterized protein si:dkeyp-38g8.5 n=1 Tax=Corythoichthys intestinalis TaxID=161448 RepID=UPI0025A666FC|nr:uncharacterized protein si:dkeyp-38g8.5 [Corythoichthys intestinalis]
MDFQDHAYTSTTDDIVNPVEMVYKLNAKEMEEFVKLRMTNRYLFSGKRNTSIWAWKAILRHMGLQDKMNNRQAAKKWENLKKRYKDLKFQENGQTWHHYTLMDDAMEGRLEGSAPVLVISPLDKVYNPPEAKKRKMIVSPVEVAQIEVLLDADVEAGDEDCRDDNRTEDSQEFTPRDEATERESRAMELERMALQRDRELLEREIAILERERALLEREKLLIEREKEMVAKDRDAINRERMALEKQKSTSVGESPFSYDTTSDRHSKDKTERFLDLFEKLVANF